MRRETLRLFEEDNDMIKPNVEQLWSVLHTPEPPQGWQVFVRPPPGGDFALYPTLLASPFQKGSSLVEHYTANCVSETAYEGLSQWPPESKAKSNSWKDPKTYLY